jgi:hypothetical protein
VCRQPSATDTAGFLVTKRDHTEDRFPRDVVGEILDDLDSLGVRPVQVLEQEHAARTVTQGGEQPDHGFPQHHERLLAG